MGAMREMRVLKIDILTTLGVRLSWLLFLKEGVHYWVYDCGQRAVWNGAKAQKSGV